MKNIIVKKVINRMCFAMPLLTSVPFVEALDSNNASLSRAIYDNEPEAVEKLIKGGRIEINKQDKFGNTPLHLAASSGNEDIVKVLLKMAGIIEVNKKNQFGNTPLHVAADRGYIDIVEALLGSEGIKVNRPNDDGNTPLHLAVFEENKAIVKVLLEVKGIEVNEPNNDGKTPLHMAVDKGNEAIVRALLDKEAKLYERDKFGRTPLGLAEGLVEGNERIKRLLKEAMKH